MRDHPPIGIEGKNAPRIIYKLQLRGIVIYELSFISRPGADINVSVRNRQGRPEFVQNNSARGWQITLCRVLGKMTADCLMIGMLIKEGRNEYVIERPQVHLVHKPSKISIMVNQCISINIMDISMACNTSTIHRLEELPLPDCNCLFALFFG